MANHTPIDFAGLAAALLARADALVREWLPGGVERNGRWYVGDFDGGEGESANVNLLTGQWIDNEAPDEDKGGDLISLYARIHNIGNGEAARRLRRDLGWERPTDLGPSGTAATSQTSAPAEAPPGAAPGPAAEPATKPGKLPRWRAVTPVPSHAPPPKFVFGYKDKKQGNRWVEQTAVRTWEYRFEGALLGHVARFERISSDGEVMKDTIALTWCENLEDGRGTQRWHWKQWEQPRPLYVPATILSADLQLPVVVVEGEKCAEAGHRLLGHEFDFVSWPGGCKAWAMASWGWLMGRTVYLWPDCDAQRERLTKAEREAGTSESTKPYRPADKQAGMAAMVHIGTHLLADNGCTVFMCPIPQPGDVADGWDIADAIAGGWDAARVRDFIRSARAFVPPTDEARAKVSPADPAAGAGDGDDDDDIKLGWRGKLLEGANGAIKAVRENVVLAVDGMRLPDGRWLPGIPEVAGIIAFNEFTNNVVKLKPTPWGTQAGEWDETEELELGDWLTRTHWLPPMSRQTLEEAVSMVARRHRFHPVRERLQALRGKWDGEKRLATWLARCCLKGGIPPADDPLQQYLARVGTWVFMAIAARVLPVVMHGKQQYQGPGTKFDYMLILEGPQGMFKSTLSSLLALDWHADTGLVLGEKDSYQNLQGILVYEWGELDALTKAEVTKVKQFISSTKDRFRASFDRRPRDYPRQVVFVGTTNESHYLSDPTGNRRFWPVRVTRPIDTGWVADNLDQLFAEALEYLAAGERFYPTLKEQVQLFDPQQLERTVENALEAAIRRYLYDEHQKVPHNGVNGSLLDRVSLADLLNALGISLDKQTQAVVKQASAALGRLGWERASRATGKGGKARPWLYHRPPESAEQEPAAGNESSRPTQGEEDEAHDACPF